MVIKSFLILILSFPIYAVTTPNDFIDNYINRGEYGEIYKIDLLIFKNEFIEEVDLKEKWKTLDATLRCAVMCAVTCTTKKKI